MKRVILVLILILFTLTVFFYFRTGIGGHIYIRSLVTGVENQALYHAGIQIWQADSLIKQIYSGKNGRFALHLKPGVYDVRISGDGLLSQFRKAQPVQLFRQSRLEVLLSRGPGRDENVVSDSYIDTAMVIRTRVPERERDIWRTWKNEITGTPHRVGGSAVKIDPVTDTLQAETEARRFFAQFISDNQENTPAFSAIDLNTLKLNSAKYYNYRWYLTFRQEISHPENQTPLPVFGSHAFVILGSTKRIKEASTDIIQFGMDLYPEIRFTEHREYPDKRDALSQLGRSDPDITEIDTQRITEMVLPLPDQENSGSYQYVPVYQVFLTKTAVEETTDWMFLISAMNGVPLYREKQSIRGFSATVKARVFRQSPEEPQTLEALLKQGMLIQPENDTTLFQKGRIDIALQDDYHQMHLAPSSTDFYLYDYPLSTRLKEGKTDLFALSFADSTVSIQPGSVVVHKNHLFNAFYHLMNVRDYFGRLNSGRSWRKKLFVFYHASDKNPSFTPGQNIMQLGNTSGPHGFFSDVLYHEYTHFIYNEILNTQNAFRPGAYFETSQLSAIEEAIADYFAGSLNDDEVVSLIPDPKRFSHGKSGRHTRYLRNEMDFQTDYNPEDSPQFSSQILSGALWDMRTGLSLKTGKEKGVRISDTLILSALYAGSYETFAGFGDQLLWADDQDNRLYTGSPNEYEIRIAFQNHGIALSKFDFDAPVVRKLFITDQNGKAAENYIKTCERVTVKARLFDPGSGLHPDLITLKINGALIDNDSITMKGSRWNKEISYTLDSGKPLSKSKYHGHLAADLTVKDLNDNTIREETGLRIINDHTPPRITLINKRPVRTGNNEYRLQAVIVDDYSNTMLRFVPKKTMRGISRRLPGGEDVTGVDRQSVRISMNGKKARYRIQNLDTPGRGLKADIRFALNGQKRHHLKITAEDSVRNAGIPLEEEIRIHDDTPPKIRLISTKPEKVDVSLFRIEAMIKDSYSNILLDIMPEKLLTGARKRLSWGEEVTGIDLSSVKFIINGYTAKNPDITPVDARNHQVRVQLLFSYRGESVKTLKLTASDYAGNHASPLEQEIRLIDSTSPAIEVLENEIVHLGDKNFKIKIRISDSNFIEAHNPFSDEIESGVDPDSIQVWIDGHRDRSHRVNIIDELGNEVEVILTCNINKKHRLKVTACDKAGNQSELCQDIKKDDCDSSKLVFAPCALALLGVLFQQTRRKKTHGI